MIPSIFKRFSRKLEIIPFYEYLYSYREFRKKKIMHKLIGKFDPVILEIGAYDGQDTLDFLKIFPEARIYSFEPDPRIFENLKRKFEDSRVEIINKAISDKDGIADFFLSSSKFYRGGSSSLRKPKEHLKIFPWINFDEIATVETITLDSWVNKINLDRIDLIWSDVQGCEGELIRGGGRTLNEKTFLFCTEFYNNEMYQGQIGLKEMMKMLPNFSIIKQYSHELILKNTKLSQL